MESEKEEVFCPLCHGHGRDRKELLVVRWRSREFEQEMQRVADEAISGTSGGMDVASKRAGLQQRIRLSGGMATRVLTSCTARYLLDVGLFLLPRPDHGVANCIHHKCRAQRDEENPLI